MKEKEIHNWSRVSNSSGIISKDEIYVYWNTKKRRKNVAKKLFAVIKEILVNTWPIEEIMAKNILKFMRDTKPQIPATQRINIQKLSRIYIPKLHFDILYLNRRKPKAKRKLETSVRKKSYDLLRNKNRN
jgi:hypothetical protein